ncbi:MAG TPA: hypothetical protein VNP72_06445 [Longimicrobium sp.]|nr:hypothetical protein [Longimicrobium sp.]
METWSEETLMAQNDNRNVGSDDNARNLEHLRNVEENTQALADQARRVDATAPESTSRPVEAVRAPGMGGEDNAQAAENVRNVEENTRALADQADRVNATAPDDVNRSGPPQQR